VTGAICDHPSGGTDFLTQVQGTGILALGVAPGAVISQNVVTNNDIGIAVGSTVDCCRLTQNRLRDNRCNGMAVVDGRQTISNTTVTGGLVGVVSVSFGSANHRHARPGGDRRRRHTRAGTCPAAACRRRSKARTSSADGRWLAGALDREDVLGVARHVRRCPV
jgi:hypothetical protein